MSQHIVSADERSGSLGASQYWVAAHIVALTLFAAGAVWLQRQLGADADVHWLVDEAGRWLGGQTPYVDFTEINPPASILVYVLPTAFARAFGLGADAVTQASVAFLALAELTIGVVMARRAGLAEEFGSGGLFWSAAALLLLPGFAFAQRDHVALILAAPLFVLMTARALSRSIDSHWAVVAGFGGGCMIGLRPHYALALVPAALYAAHRGGWRLSAWLPEVIAGALVLLGYAASLGLAFPHFFSDALPIDLAIYVGGGRLVLWALPWFTVWLLLALALWGTRRPLIASMPAQLLALASAGALASYFIQGKGWPYHIYVADALLLASFAIANRRALPQTGLAALVLALVLAAGSFALAYAFLAPGDALYRVLADGLSLASALLTVRLAFISPDDSGRTRPLQWTRLGVAVLAIATGEMALLEGAHPPYFRAEMASLGPRPKIALISGNGSYGIDLATQTGGLYSPRASASYIVELATDRLKRGDVAAATRAVLSRYIREDRDRLAATIRDEKPDAIVVDPLWAERYLDEPFLRSLLEGYRLQASEKIPKRFFPKPPLQLFTRDSGREAMD